MLTAKEVAMRLNAGESSVRLWAKQGKFKGARLEDSPIGAYWLIPESALDSFEMGKAGRPPKTESERSSPKRITKKKA